MLKFRTFFLIFILVFMVFPINIYAKHSKNKLEETREKFKSYNSKLAFIADEIFQYEKDVKKLNFELSKLNQNLKKEEFKFNKQSLLLKNLQDKQEKLLKEQQKVHSKIALLTASIVSLSIITEGKGFYNHEGVIINEIYDTVRKINSGRIETFNKDLHKRKKVIDEITKKVNTLKGNIEAIENKRIAVHGKRERIKNIGKKLKNKKLKYQKIIKKIKLEQKAFEKEFAELKKQKPQIDISQKKNFSSKKGKTISPLDNYSVLKKYGNFTDPVYNIKMFNTSITLKPAKSGDVVRNVFNGKISLIKATPLLGNIVIIEHYNGMQTIYAHLDSTSPNISVGKKIKKGTIIGKVYKELHFEIIKQNRHINPLTIIE